MNQLSNKVLSYSPEVYYRFNEAYTLTPTNSGSVGSTTFTLTNETPTYISSGGIHSQGCWNFGFGRGVQDNTASTIINTTVSDATNTPFSDNDYSLGFWFKSDFTLNNANAHANTWTIAVLGGTSTTRGIALQIIGGAASSANKGKFQVITVSGSSVISPNRIDDQQWHYIAAVAVPNGSSITFTYYIDGVSIGTSSPTVGSGLTTTTRFGGLTQSTTNIGKDRVLFNSSPTNINEFFSEKYGLGEYTQMNLYGYITDDVLSSESAFRDIDSMTRRKYKLGTKYEVYNDFLGDKSQFNRPFGHATASGGLGNFFADGWTYSFSGTFSSDPIPSAFTFSSS